MVTRTILVRRFACVRCPVPGPPRSESVAWLVSVLPAAGFPVGRCIGFAVVMAQVRRPVPFRTRKLRPGRGDGTALERVWESSTPPHSTLEDPPVESLMGFPEGPFFFVFPLGVPVGRHAPGTPIFVCFSSGFFRAFTDLPATPFRLVEGVFRGLRPSRSSGPPGRASMTPRRVLLLSPGLTGGRGSRETRFSLMTVWIGWLDAAGSWMPRYFRMLSKTSSTLSRYSFLPM